MRYVLIALSGGIIQRVTFFEDPGLAVRALSEYVKAMDPEDGDAAVFGLDGIVACAKDFLEQVDFKESRELNEAVQNEAETPLYVIANPNHSLGFMVASADDPLAFRDPLEALSELGQMRKDFGSHLKLYRVFPIDGPVTGKEDLEKFNVENEIDGFDYTLVEEYLLDARKKA